MGAGAEGGEEKKEEDDAEVARQLHRAMNCTPARSTRHRGPRDRCKGLLDDPVRRTAGHRVGSYPVHRAMNCTLHAPPLQGPAGRPGASYSCT